jgi:hypothetical protein
LRLRLNGHLDRLGNTVHLRADAAANASSATGKSAIHSSGEIGVMDDGLLVAEADLLDGGFCWSDFREELARVGAGSDAAEHAKRLMFANRELLLRMPDICPLGQQLEVAWQCGECGLAVRFDARGVASYDCWPRDWLLSMVLEGLADATIRRAAEEIRRAELQRLASADMHTAEPRTRKTKRRRIPTVECLCECCGRMFRRSVYQDQRNDVRGYHTYCSRRCSAWHRRASDGRMPE